MNCPKCEMPDSLESIDSFYHLEKGFNEYNSLLFEIEIWKCKTCSRLFYKVLKADFIAKLDII